MGVGDTVATPEDEVDDAGLVLRLQRRDESALAALYDRHSALAFTLACRIVGDRPTAEEIVQDAFLSIWRNAGRYDPTLSSFRSWMITIIRNRCFDKLRSRSVRPQLSPEVEIAEQPAGTDVWREVEQTVTSEGVRQALGSLPAEQRETVELAYYGGLSQSEIAQRMGVPIGTVKGRIRMSFQKLRDSLANLRLEDPLHE